MTQKSKASKYKVSILETVYSPMSNQEAIWLKDDPEVEELLRRSDFYMIAGRAEGKFLNIKTDSKACKVKFDFTIGDHFSDPVEINVYDLPGVKSAGLSDVFVDAGAKGFRVWDRDQDAPGAKVLEWFTTEKLIRDRYRNKAGICRFDRYREAAIYDLLYVGIAKVGDSFDRLINHGHKARMEILGNEPQRYPGARVSDEIYLFLFSVQPNVITTFDLDHEFNENDLSNSYDQKRIVADAEKAFVSLLKPEYNVVKFGSYPKGDDGLYGSDFIRYAYAIREPFSFNTAHGRIRGGWNSITGEITNEADFILVEGDTVKLFVAGIDFPAGPASSFDSDPNKASS